MDMRLFVVMPIGTTLEGDFIISEKFIEGIKGYLQNWPGTITVHAIQNNQQKNFMDGHIYKASQLPFAIDFTPFNDPVITKSLEKADLIVAQLECVFLHLSELSKKLNIPIIYISEYTYKTQKQILYVEKINFILKLRRLFWLYLLKEKMDKVVKEADGIQCNGTPTYETYSRLNSHPLLFFDSRVTSSLLATPEDLMKKLATLITRRPLRLAFSGRLIAIKGVDHLIPIAKELKCLGVDFHLDICGDGELKEFLKQQIIQYDLQSDVTIKGKLDFTSELVPFMKTAIDLFVCPHVQGDPSCTYLEVMSCGVPIVGYDNEAFKGLSRYSNTGWPSPLGNPKALALKIKELSKDREKIREGSYAALKFASKHTMELAFKARVQHFLDVYTRFNAK